MRMSEPTTPTVHPVSAVVVDAPHEVERSAEILSPDALAFLAELQARFGTRRDELLEARRSRRAEVSRTGRLDFLEETRQVREGDWTVAPAPADFADRRVEITGPTERKMAINALNSGAKVWLADLEDANTPHWDNVIGGQVSLYDAVRRTIELTAPNGKHYELKDPDAIPVIVPRPRGWHFDEEHLTLDGRPLVGALVDFGLYFFHNAAELVARGSGPYFYLPKMESHLEARLWNDVFTFAQEAVGIPHGTIRATVLIETIPAAFEMDEILFELREHMAGLNAGRWDYLFSIIKNFRDAGPAFTLPDRNAVTMNAPMMKAYSDLLVRTCHRRGAFAIGGMAAFIPSRRDPEINERAFAKVREDKTREAAAGFDGSWVAHPDLVPLCAEIFAETLGERTHQLDVRRDDVHVTAADLLAVDRTPGERTEHGLRGNIRIGIQYLQAWLSGNGAAGIDNLMEDAATAEISRSQVWQWVFNKATLDTGEVITRDLVERIVEEEYAALRDALGEQAFAAGHWAEARSLFVGSALSEEFPDFLTLPAYAALLAAESS
jgi:malate synthase